ncbi:MAG: peptide chain release factor 1 [Gammaproteobacteria bacterium]|nr:peptide chain release factor 1 [Gammaproteobacteria bacterium]
MKDSIIHKLETIRERHEEISMELSDMDVAGNQERFTTLSREYAQLEPIVKRFNEYQRVMTDLAAVRELLNDQDESLKAMALEEIETTEQRIERLECELNMLLLPKDPHDQSNVFLEIRAGTGGDEAAIFAGDLFRMYSRYAEGKKWKMEVIHKSEGDHGGFKEIIAKISGTDVYSSLKFESGAHRVQRVPVTESQGRVHTSAATIAIMPEVNEIDNVAIDTADLRVDIFRASGAGGQHVNKTDSAIRITHLPTGIAVECQDERSQHKNRARAMSLLSARLLDNERKKQSEEQAETRRSLVGSGDRSERIRTYNFPQGRITDHRINLTLYKLDEMMQGNIDQVIQPLRNEYQADLLASIDEQ